VTKTMDIHADSSRPNLVLGRFSAPLIGNGSPRRVMSMYLLHRLPGQRAYPTGSPAEYSGAKQRAEEPWDSILKSPTHHADSCENEAAETDDGAGVYRKSFERPHKRLSSREVHRSLGVGNTSECQGNQGWTHRSRNTNKFLFGKV
jgi:hypothetical protein